MPAKTKIHKKDLTRPLTPTEDGGLRFESLQ